MQLIILDRDGVINEDSDNYIRSADEWHPIPGSIEAIAKLSKAGFLVAVATNQSGIGRGYYTLSDLEAMHSKLNYLVEQAGGHIVTIKFCPHLPDKNCDCRKPKLGLIHQIEDELHVSAKGSWFIGDSFKDIQAAQLAHCKPILVRTGKGTITLQKPELSASIPIYDDLGAFVDTILKEA